MELKVGDRVRIKNQRGAYWNSEGEMDKWMGQDVTIRSIDEYGSVKIEEDCKENCGTGWTWKHNDFEPVNREDELKEIILPIREFARRYGYKQLSVYYIDDEKTEFLNAFTSLHPENLNVSIFESKPKKLTLAEIEAELGYKVEIVEEEKTNA